MQQFRDVAKLYPTIKAEEMIVDNTCMQVPAAPSRILLVCSVPIRQDGSAVHSLHMITLHL